MTVTEAVYAFVVGFVVCSTVAYFWYRQQLKNDD